MTNPKHESPNLNEIQRAYVDLSAGSEVVMQFSNSRPSHKVKQVAKDYCAYRAGWPLFRRIVGRATYSRSESIDVTAITPDIEYLTVGHIASRTPYDTSEPYDKGIFYIATYKEYWAEPQVDLSDGHIILPADSPSAIPPYIQAVEVDNTTVRSRYREFYDRLVIASEAIGMLLPQLQSEHMKFMDKS